MPTPERREPRRSAARNGRLAAALLMAMATEAVPLDSARAQAPGPESFATPPQTPLELWDAADYLVRTGQAAQAVPYLDAFAKSNPSDDILVQIRDRYGSGSFLRLDDDPATRPYAEPLLKRMSEAAVRRARDPERLKRYVAALTGSPAEQRYAIDQLRSAGPYAVPALVEGLNGQGLSRDERTKLALGMASLEPTALPALVAVLDSPDPDLAADAAEALGLIGDRRAVPFLTYLAGRPDESAPRDAARRAIGRLTGRTWAAQPEAPAPLLVREARKYLTHKVQFPADNVELWTWEGNGPVPRPATRSQAEGELGLKLARQALELDPSSREAQVMLVALALQKTEERGAWPDEPGPPLPIEPLTPLSSGAAAPPSAATEPATTPDPAADALLSQALGAGPDVLGDVVRLGLHECLPEVAEAGAVLLGRVTGRNNLSTLDGQPHPLVAALSSTDRRVRFAAAEALVRLEPTAPFVGSSRVVPTLAPFLAPPAAPRAVVVDGNPNRANQVAGVLRGLGYDPVTATDGREGFRLASGDSTVEAILLEPTLLQGPWSSRDLLSNLRADATTGGLPVLLYGPLAQKERMFDRMDTYSGVGFVVTPSDPRSFGPILSRELDRLRCARPLSAADREALTARAAALLGLIARGDAGGPYAADLDVATTALIDAVAGPSIAPPVLDALAAAPRPEAQRRLADVALDPAISPAIRRRAGRALAQSLARFGPLVTDAQERRLAAVLNEANLEPALREDLSAALGALRPEAAGTGRRLQGIDPDSILTAPATPAAAPAPDPATAPEPEGAPPAAEPPPAPEPGEEPTP